MGPAAPTLALLTAALAGRDESAARLLADPRANPAALDLPEFAALRARPPVAKALAARRERRWSPLRAAWAAAVVSGSAALARADAAAARVEALAAAVADALAEALAPC
jgi:hypothetical protein